MALLRLAAVLAALAVPAALAHDASVRLFPRPSAYAVAPKVANYDAFSLICNSLGLEGIALEPSNPIAQSLVVPAKPFAPKISASVLFVVDADSSSADDLLTSSVESLEILATMDRLDDKIRSTAVHSSVSIYSSEEVNTESIVLESVSADDVVSFLGDKASDVKHIVHSISSEEKYAGLWEEIRGVVATLSSVRIGSSGSVPDVVVFRLTGVPEEAITFVNALIESSVERLGQSGRAGGAAIYVSDPVPVFRAWVRRQAPAPLPAGVYNSLAGCQSATSNCNQTYLGFTCQQVAGENTTAVFACRSALGRFWTTDACVLATGNCSKQGNCTLAPVPDRFINKTTPQNYYACLCTGTARSGQACQSEDISPQFNILTAVTLIFAFVLVVVIVATCTAADDSDLTILGGSSGRAKTD